MTQMSRRLFAFVAAITLTALLAGPAMNAQTSAGVGTVTGRVFNAATGLYLNNARISVAGTNITAQTDETGTYILTRVPLGVIILEAFYTGMEPRQVTLTIDAPATTVQDIEFTAADRRAASGDSDTDLVQLEKFTVTERTMDGAAIAINEQRFAPNLVNVVSTDEYGIVPDGNVGEFLKMLPGVTMSYRQGDPREISINGVSSANVPVTVDGFDLASSEQSGSGRNVELNAISINTLSRVEVIFSPTPETRGDALAGSVNMVPRSAFERRKPQFTATTYMYWRTNTPQFYSTSGPRHGKTFKARPGFELSWIMPVTRNFGFTVSAGASFQYKEAPLISPTWRGTASQTNPGNNFPDTIPGQPYMSAFQMQDTLAENTRTSFAASADWRFAPNDVLSFRFTYGTFNSRNTTRTMTYNLTNLSGGDFSPTHSHGIGQINLQTGYNNRYTQTIMPTLRYRHKGPVWATDMGIGWSNAQQLYRSADRGMFQTVNSRRGQVRINLDDINYIRPETITVTDNLTGAPVDPYDFSNYVLISTNANQPTINNDKVTAFANAERALNWKWPFFIKLGLDYRSEKKDQRNYNRAWNFLGADGRTSTYPTATGDDNAAPFQDTNYRQRVYLAGFPAIPCVDNIALYEFFLTSPDYFASTNNGEDDYRSYVSNSQKALEKITAAYLRFDTQLLDGRLNLVGGVRVERTDVQGWGPLTDPTRNHQYDADGNMILDGAGKPVPLYTDSFDILRATYIERGAHSRKEYTTWFPSINASYILHQNLVARAAFYQSIGRPNFNQYSGGIRLPAADAENPEERFIVVNNAGIKPWHANSYKVALEYYFKKVGLVSVGAFARDYKDFFGETMFVATPDFLQMHGINPDNYAGYNVRTQTNIAGIVHTYGLDLNYKQALAFLPHWARGMQVTANWSWLSIHGAQADMNFSAFTPRAGSLGLSLTRPKYTVRLNLNYTSRTKQTLLGSVELQPDGTYVTTPLRSGEPGTYQYRGERFFMDVRAEYSLTRTLGVFASVSGVALTKETEDSLIYGPSTPAHATLNQRTSYYPLWTIGVKGKW